MKPLLLDTPFPAPTTDISAVKRVVRSTGELPVLESLTRAQKLDALVWNTHYLLSEGRITEAVSMLDTLIFDESYADVPLLPKSWLWIARMAIFIAGRDFMLALGAAENALNLLVAVPHKKKEDFLALVASLLYQLAYVHSEMGDTSRAQKELTKCQKLYERLAKKNRARFSPMLLYAVEASTDIINSKSEQMKIFAHYEDEVKLYTSRLTSGDERATRDALVNLIDSLKKEGEIMLEVGNGRDAMKYFTRALKYQKKLSPAMGLKELRLTLALAKALCKMPNRRESGEQLLASLRPLAKKLRAANEMIEIENLINNINRNVNIMVMLKGIF